MKVFRHPAGLLPTLSPMSRQAKDIRVLVIDDSKTIRRTAEVLLQREGFSVQSAEDGFMALPIVAEFRPDLIFVDIMMPKLDGYQTCALVKSHPRFRHIPVVMLSSKDGLFDKARGRIVGADHYITKPFTRDELLEVIGELFKDLAASA